MVRFNSQGCRWAFPCALLSLFLFVYRSAHADDWPQFRGPEGQGHSAAHGLPLRWSEEKNVSWKVSVPGSGLSSPVVSNGKVWLTTCDTAEGSLRVLSYDAISGAVICDRSVFHPADLGEIHAQNSHATPTVVVQDGYVYAHFGAHGTACLSTDSEVLWTTCLNYYHHHGPAASPIIVDDLLVISCDGFTGPFWDQLVRDDVDQFQFLAALDRRTGVVQWKYPKNGRHSYSTPLVISVDGHQQVISVGGDQVIACDPVTGNEIWTCRFGGYSVVPCPVYANGLVLICTGYGSPSLLAIRPDGQGDVTGTHVAWNVRHGVPLTVSPIVAGDDVYLMTDNGVLTCLDLKTGIRLWRDRIRGEFSASPILVDGRMYFPTEAGVVHVLEPGKHFERLAANKLDGHIRASMAVSDGAFYIRTEDSLYRIEDGDPDPDGE